MLKNRRNEMRDEVYGNVDFAVLIALQTRKSHLGRMHLYDQQLQKSTGNQETKKKLYKIKLK